MKNLIKTVLFAIIVTISMVSCDHTAKPYDRKNSMKHTTLEILNNIDTTYTVSIGELDNDRIYLLKDNKVVHEGYVLTNTGLSPFDVAYVFISTMLLIIGIVFLVIHLNE